MKKAVAAGSLFVCFLFAGCNGYDEKNTDPMNVIPTTGDDSTDAKIWEVPPPKPRQERGETVYPLLYGKETALTRDREEWESWLQDPSRAPLPQLQDDRAFVLAWCHKFARYEPEEVALILMNYFEYDYTFSHMQPVWFYRSNPNFVFVSWYELRRAIVDKTLVCAGYAQLFYLIVREKHPDVKYIQSNQLNHARNYFEDEHWDITWLDDAGVNYDPNKIKLDFVGMQKRIAGGIGGNVGSDWKTANIVVGEHNER